MRRWCLSGRFLTRRNNSIEALGWHTTLTVMICMAVLNLGRLIHWSNSFDFIAIHVLLWTSIVMIVKDEIKSKLGLRYLSESNIPAISLRGTPAVGFTHFTPMRNQTQSLAWEVNALTTWQVHLPPYYLKNSSNVLCSELRVMYVPFYQLLTWDKPVEPNNLMECHHKIERNSHNSLYF